MKMYIVKESEYRPLKGKKIGLQSIGGSKNPNPSRKTLDERIADAVAKAIKPLAKDIKSIFDILERNSIR